MLPRPQLHFASYYTPARDDEPLHPCEYKTLQLLAWDTSEEQKYEKSGERRKYFVNFPAAILDWQANNLERLWQSHWHKYKTACLI